ncbi:MAG: hypothetical protein FJZ79_09980 [Chlorobi bacterium]|nr:hypothetical protein [Chlorobiota bacterium]
MSANRFAGADGVLDTNEAALYLAFVYKMPLSSFLKPETMQIDPRQVAAVMEDRLDDLRSLSGHEAPWPADEIDKLYATTDPVARNMPENGWKNIKGVTKPLVYSDSTKTRIYGPVRLRKTIGDLRLPLKDAKGVTIAFSDNRLVKGAGAWNTQGVLGYPISLYTRKKSGQSTEFELLPTMDWKRASIEGVPGSDIEELGFSVPMTIYHSPGGKAYTGTYEENVLAAESKILSGLWVITARPYVQTDFSLDHLIYGVEASAEYIGGVFGSGLYVGGYQNTGINGLQYQLRIVPKIDFSTTAERGRCTTRSSGDDLFRIGGLLACDLRFFGTSFNSLNIGTSYEVFHSLNNTIENAELLRTYATLWLNENVGMTFEYSKGETPLSLKDIDLLSLGLEFKY